MHKRGRTRMLLVLLSVYHIARRARWWKERNLNRSELERKDTARELLAETHRLVRRDIPVETIERELQKPISLMNRIFLHADQLTEDPSMAEPFAPGALMAGVAAL
jgi:hypothetical protein